MPASGSSKDDNVNVHVGVRTAGVAGKMRAREAAAKEKLKSYDWMLMEDLLAEKEAIEAEIVRRAQNRVSNSLNHKFFQKEYRITSVLIKPGSLLCLKVKVDDNESLLFEYQPVVGSDFPGVFVSTSDGGVNGFDGGLSRNEFFRGYKVGDTLEDQEAADVFKQLWDHTARVLGMSLAELEKFVLAITKAGVEEAGFGEGAPFEALCNPPTQTQVAVTKVETRWI